MACVRRFPLVGVRVVGDGAFALADGINNERYQNLRIGDNPLVTPDGEALLVKADVARRQIEADIPTSVPAHPSAPSIPTEDGSPSKSPTVVVSPVTPGGSTQPPTRFYATKTLTANRVASEASDIANEVVQHLSSLLGADVRITIDIEAVVPSGIPDQVVRIVRENCKTMKFQTQNFDS